MVGRAALQQQWQTAVELLLQPDRQSTEEVRRAKQCWAATRDAQAALKLMPPYRQTENGPPHDTGHGVGRWGPSEAMLQRCIRGIGWGNAEE